MGEADESLSDEQTEEVTEPSEEVSDEEISGDEGDNIANEDPSEEDPATEEPSEGDAEEPVEEEAADSEAADNEYTLMATEGGDTGDEKYTVTVEYDADAVELGTGVFEEKDGVTSCEVEKDGTLIFTAEAKTGSEITGVTYRMGAATKDSTLTAGGEDKKTYVLEKVTGNVKIKIASRTECKVTFAAKDHENVTDINTIKINSTNAKPAKIDGDGDWEIPAYIGDKVSFKLTPATPYKIASVTVDGKEVTPASGVYTITKLEGDAKVVIATELDSAKSYKLTVNLSGQRDSATLVSISESEDAAEAPDFGKTELFKFTEPTKADVTLVVKPNEGYEIISVKKGNTSLEEEKTVSDVGTGEQAYKIPFVAADKSKGVTVTVTTEATALGDDESKTVTFSKDADAGHLTYTVTGSATKVEGEDDKYTLTKGAKSLDFTVTATGAYAPVVKRGGAVVNGTKGKTTGKGATKTTPYTYSIPATTLSSEDGGETITIEEEPIKYVLTVTGNADVDWVVSVNGKVYTTPTELQALAADVTYNVQEDTVVTVQATQKAGTTLTSLVSTVGSKTTTKKAAKGAAEIVVTATDDITIEANTGNVYTRKPLEAADENTSAPTTDKNGVYGVSYDGKYKAAVEYGYEHTAAEFSKAQILDGKTVLDTWEGTATDVFDSVTDGDGITININGLKGKKDAKDKDIVYQGKKLTVNLYTEETGDKVAVATYALQVSQEITSIKTKSASVTQVADTKEKYPLILSKNGELGKVTNAFKATASDTDMIKSATINAKGELEIVTGTKTGNTEVKIVPTADGATTPSCTLKVNVTPILDSTKTAGPTVKVEKADDISFTLGLTAKNIKNPEDGTVWYEIQATAIPKAKEGEEETSKLKDKVVKYVAKGAADTQSVKVELANDGTVFGKGEAKDYKVEVRLVYTAGGTDLAEATAINSSITVFSKTTTVKKCSTLKPAYETKLTLKKGTTTVSTGEEDVTVATAQFSKATTYTSIVKAVDSITTGGLTIDEDSLEENKIVVSAAANTALGAHTITVYAENGLTEDENSTAMQYVTAQIKVTVVKGINGLEVTVPSYKIYKQDKKAATLKANVIYNGSTDKSVQPKKKSVKWLIVDESDKELTEESRLYKKVTINNSGTVTVDKSYVISADGESDSFCIKAVATDFAGNKTESKVCGPIVITNEPEKIQTLALVAENADKKLQPIAVQDASAKGLTPFNLTATQVNGAQLVAFSTAVTTDSKWDDEDALKEACVASTNLSFKSSSAKDVVVDADGTISVIKPPKKGVKLTATVNDGSKAKADISINIAYDEVTELSLKVEQDEDGKGLYKEITAKADNTYEYTDSTYFKLTVVVPKENGDPDEAPDFTDYSIKAKSGAKVVSTNGNKVLLATNAATAKIELTNNAEKDKAKKTKTYTLTNTGVATAAAPKVTVAGSFRQNASPADQEVSLQMEVDAVTKLEGANAVYAEVDQSARTTKNEIALDQLASQIQLGVLNIDDKTINVKGKDKAVKSVALKGTGEETVALTPGSYKLKVTVGKVDGGKFAPLAKTVSVTVKVDKDKALTFTPAASYTINTRDGVSVELTAKTNAAANEYKVKYTLYNANINGQPNSFKDIFELSDEGDCLRLQKNLENIPKSTVGYLGYTVSEIKDYYTNNEEGIEGLVKITVKVETAKPKAAFAVDNSPTIEVGTDKSTSVIVTANKGIIEIASAMADTTGWEAEAAEDHKTVTVTNKTATLKKNTSYSIILYVIPADSYYLDRFNTPVTEEGGEEGEEKKGPTLEDYKAYGIKLTAKIKAVDPLDIAENDVKAWVKATADAAKNANKAPAWLTNDLNAKALEAQAQEALKSDLPKDVEATVAIAETGEGEDATDDFSITKKANLTAAGEVKGNLAVTIGSVTRKVPFTFVIQKGRITKEEAKELIVGDAAVKAITFSNDDDTADAKAAKKKAILEAATKAIKGSPYTVGVKDEKDLTITAATAGVAGEATITLLVKDGDDDANPEEVELKYEIKALPNE